MKANRKLLNRLIGALALLVTAAQEQQNRREKAALLRQARALRAVPQVRQVARAQAEIELAKVPPIGRAVVAAAYDVPMAQGRIEDLQASWDNFDAWTYGGYDGS